MRRRIAGIGAIAGLLVALALGTGSGLLAAGTPPRAPSEFFGIAPQSPLTKRDLEYMRAGGIGYIRLPVPWSAVQERRRGGYNWSGLDEGVSAAAKAGLRVLPFLYGSPSWVTSKPTNLPIDSPAARTAWTKFLTAAVERYGPGGEFWKQLREESLHYGPPVRALPIRSWQVWNEANFFYFATPASPTRYATLLKLSSQAIKAADPGAKVVLSGLFGHPDPGYPKGMAANQFLERLYRVPGIEKYFDGVALHPYAINATVLEQYVESFHEVTVENHDHVPLYITEMGWGSQNDYQEVAFEHGVQGQARELRRAYTYLLENRHRLDVKQVYWFSWKDIQGDCNFCDSVGLFHEGRGFRAKPAWSAFVALSGGSSRP